MRVRTRLEISDQKAAAPRGLPSPAPARPTGWWLVAPAFAIAMVFGGLALSQQRSYQVVAHPTVSLESISKKDLARYFLKRKKAWPDGTIAAPVDQKPGAAVRDSFSTDVLGKSSEAVEAFWNGQVFAGKDSPPPSMGSDAEVVSHVSRTPGAVGYVSPGTSLAGVKPVTVTD